MGKYTLTKLYAVAAILLCVIIWGISFIFIKVAVDNVPPVILNLVRFGTASLFLFAFLKIKENKTRLKREDVILTAVTGFLGISLYYYLETISLKYIPASSAGLVSGTIPIFTLVGEAIILKRKIRFIDITGFLLSITGLVFIMGAGSRISSMQAAGYVFMLVGVASWVVYTIYTKVLMERYSSLACVTYQTLFGVAFFIPFSVFELFNTKNISMLSRVIHSADILIPVLANIVFMGIVSSGIAYCLYNYGMAVIGVSTASFFMNVTPVVSLAAGAIMLNEAITFNKVLGSALIIISVFIVNIGDVRIREARNIYVERNKDSTSEYKWWK